MDDMKPARPEDIPVATHTGEWDFAGMKIRVHKLDDGRAVIEAADFEKIMKWMESGVVPDDPDSQTCEHCSKSFPIETCHMMADCWICDGCYKEWKATFDACARSRDGRQSQSSARAAMHHLYRHGRLRSDRHAERPRVLQRCRLVVNYATH